MHVVGCASFAAHVLVALPLHVSHRHHLTPSTAVSIGCTRVLLVGCLVEHAVALAIGVGSGHHGHLLLVVEILDAHKALVCDLLRIGGLNVELACILLISVHRSFSSG